MQPILEAKDIKKSFGGIHALKGVNFSLRRGEVHALLGENGAGKSTFIKIISGAHLPDTGEFTIRGEHLTNYSPQRAREMGIATIYQETSLFPDLTVAENLFAGEQPRTALGMVDWKTMRKRAREIFDQLGVYIPVHERLGDLGKASAQMVEIAKALSRDADILIMDEPTAALSGADAENLYGIIERIKAKGTAIIFISHHLEEIFKVSDRVTILRDGVVGGTAETKEVDEKWVITQMIGKEMDESKIRTYRTPGRELLQVKGLTREGYFTDVNFTLYEGEILGIAGLVGAGKTELLRTLFAIDGMDGGQILMEGEPLPRKPYEVARRGIGLVPENRGREGLLLDLEATLNLSMINYRRSSRYGLLNRASERTTARDSFESLRIKPANAYKLKAANFSGGNQQKIVLGKWLADNPKVMLLDDPTQGVDINAKNEIHRLLDQLVNQGMGIVLVSSDFQEIANLADRVMIMRSGRIDTILQDKPTVAALHEAVSGTRERTGDE
ncbi:MAG: sugar ABC transporter ATP-binding protein [Planctomycetaceae bacterium]|nr:sugar ABC transporter ATP-binding protein [Planctomycetaceae bacterium]